MGSFEIGIVLPIMQFGPERTTPRWAELGPRLATLEAICEELGRDPASIGRGAGLSVNPTLPAGARPGVISGSAEEIADALRTFREAGYTQVDLMPGPGTVETFDALAPVVEMLRAG